MLVTLIKKEILESILSLRFLIASLLCVTLIPLGTYVNLKEYEQRLADYQEAERIYEQRSEGNLESDFQALGYRPPSAFSVFSVGLERFLPNKIATSRDGNVRVTNELGINSPYSLLFGKVDLLFNVTYVLSLLALLFTFSSISGEKEEGTLKLIISHPVPRWKILVGKIIGSYIVLLLPFLVAAFISTIILESSNSVQIFSANMLPSISIILIATLVFILTMLNLGVLISTLTHRSIVSIVALLLCWTLLVLSWPKISPMLAEIAYPLKSLQVVNIQKSLMKDQLEKEMDTKLADAYTDLAVGNGINPNRLFTQGSNDAEKRFLTLYDSVKATISLDYQDRIVNQLNKIDEDYRNKERTQAGIAMNLSRLSPVCCYVYVVSELSLTGPLESNNLYVNAQRFQDEVKEDLYDKFILKRYVSKSGSASSISYARGFDPQKAKVPILYYHQVSLEQIIDAETTDLILLMLYSLLFFLGSYMAFLRYDVR